MYVIFHARMSLIKLLRYFVRWAIQDQSAATKLLGANYSLTFTTHLLTCLTYLIALFLTFALFITVYDSSEWSGVERSGVE
jgi:hypothetical protein